MKMIWRIMIEVDFNQPILSYSFQPVNPAGKLIELNNSQQSIQTLSGWAIHHRRNAQQIVDVWFQQLTKCEKTVTT